MQNQTITSNCIGKEVCQILGYSEESYVEKEMNALKEYIEEQHYYEFSSALQDGTIGITVASKIHEEYEEHHDKNMLMQVYKMFLSEIANLVAMENYDAAVEKYSQMVLVLANHFGIVNLEEEKSKQYGKIFMVA